MTDLKAVSRRLCLVALASLTAGCSFLGRQPEPAAPEIELVGVAGSHVLALAADGAASLIGTSDELRDVGAMTYDRASGTLYLVNDHTRVPTLFTVDVATGAATAIGRITLPRSRFTRVEGLAFNPGDGKLYAAGGKSAFASDHLLSVDPATGIATELSRVRGTLQNEIDAMAFVDGALYAVDGVAGTTRLYRLDLATGEATALGEPFTHNVTDLAFLPATYRLLGTIASRRQLVVLTLGGETTELGPTHGEPDFDGATLTALAFTGNPETSTLFADGFESGNLSAWSKGKKR